MEHTGKRVALLIDADNAPASKIDVILAEVARRGTANVRRAYGNWKSPQLKPWEDTLHEYAIRPIQQFAYTARKNASDIAMVVDAMDLLYTHAIDAFAIVSSDADFTPLIMRIRANGVEVYGFGEKKTPAPFVSACSQFTYLEALQQPSDEAAEAGPETSKPKDLRSDTRHLQMLRNAVKSAEDDDGWAHLAEIGNQIANQASFDSRNYGYGKLSELIEATGLFDVNRKAPGVMIRDKRRK